LDKKISSSTAAAILGGAVVVLGIFGYMVFFRGSSEPVKGLAPVQQMQEKVMKMSPEERRRFGEKYADSVGNR
jgi:hypothetical protein